MIHSLVLRRWRPTATDPPWVDNVAARERRSNKSQEITYQPPSRLHHDDNVQITGAFDKLSIKQNQKTKTKVWANSTLDTTASEDGNLALASMKGRSSFKLDKRAYKAMNSLFHVAVSDSDGIPKALKWNEFTRAMVHLDFSAENLQGSAWPFNPRVPLGVERGIQSHEPHPDSEIPHIMARRYGRRLERVYGWTAETFQIA